MDYMGNPWNPVVSPGRSMVGEACSPGHWVAVAWDSGYILPKAFKGYSFTKFILAVTSVAFQQRHGPVEVGRCANVHPSLSYPSAETFAAEFWAIDPSKSSNILLSFVLPWTRYRDRSCSLASWRFNGQFYSWGLHGVHSGGRGPSVGLRAAEGKPLSYSRAQSPQLSCQSSQHLER